MSRKKLIFTICAGVLAFLIFMLLIFKFFIFKKPQADPVSNNTVDESTEIKETEINEEVEQRPSIKDISTNYIDKFVITCEDDVAEAMKYDGINYLKIDHANISDFSFLKDIKISLLQVLYNDYPVDLSYVNPEYIEQVYFHEAELKNTEAFDNFKYLFNFVMLTNRNAPDSGNFEFLANCKNITQLQIINYGITDLSFVRNMKKLVTINIENSAIEDISALSNCTELLDVILPSAKISDINGLSNLKLQCVDLSNNYISDITPLKNSMDTMSTLNLSKNYIENIDVLNNTEWCTYINLSCNYISYIPENIIKDEYLVDLSYNNISYITPEVKDKLKNTSGSVNLFDNLLDKATMEEIANYKSSFFMTCNESYLEPSQAMEFNNKIMEILPMFQSGSDKEKVVKIVKYVMENTKNNYNYDDPNKDNAYGALLSESVCGGHTDLTNTLLRHVGIKSKEYHGDFKDPNDNERHVWSYVFIDGKYYHCDSSQTSSFKTPDGLPKLVLLSDSEIKSYGHITDAMNCFPSSYTTEEERNTIHQNIMKN